MLTQKIIQQEMEELKGGILLWLFSSIRGDSYYH